MWGAEGAYSLERYDHIILEIWLGFFFHFFTWDVIKSHDFKYFFSSIILKAYALVHCIDVLSSNNLSPVVIYLFFNWKPKKIFTSGIFSSFSGKKAKYPKENILKHVSCWREVELSYVKNQFKLECYIGLFILSYLKQCL